MKSKVNTLKPEVIAEINAMMAMGEPINAIRLIRKELNCGLAVAKEEYETYIQDNTVKNQISVKDWPN